MYSFIRETVHSSTFQRCLSTNFPSLSCNFCGMLYMLKNDTSAGLRTFDVPNVRNSSIAALPGSSQKHIFTTGPFCPFHLYKIGSRLGSQCNKNYNNEDYCYFLFFYILLAFLFVFISNGEMSAGHR